ncbi:MAG: hypothetical protein PWP46_1590, partial [Fusobacteriaceae bacterium]|nr:hypothetical protein [Fusobacteriaceae bacterium]
IPCKSRGFKTSLYLSAEVLIYNKKIGGNL